MRKELHVSMILHADRYRLKESYRQKERKNNENKEKH